MKITSRAALNSPEIVRISNKKLALHYGGPFLLYLILTLIFSWPLVLNLGNSAIRVRSGDVWQNLWNIWWTQHALFGLHTNPFRTGLLYYPETPTLYLHALYPLAGLVSAPLQWLFGVVAAFNLMVILLISLSGFCAYLLGRFLNLSLGAALMAGAIFAYSPIISSQLDQGQLEQISPLWMPLYLLFFLKVLGVPNFGRVYWLNSAGAALCFLFTALTTWYYALNLVLASLFAAVWVLIRAMAQTPGFQAKIVRTIFTVRRLFGPALLCLLFTAPLLYPTLREATNTSYAVARDSSVRYNSADIVHFFRPGGSLLWFSKAEPDYEFQWFLGFIPLALALFGAITDWKRTRFWAGLALFFAILALGPVLKIGLEDYTSIEGLPMAWLQKLPLGSIVRVPIRFVTFAMLGLGIAAGFGLDSITVKLAKRWKFSRLPLALSGLALMLVFLEFYPGPRTLIDLKLPNFLGQIRNGPPGTVLEMPLMRVQPIAMFFQTVHGKPIIGGYLARKPKEEFIERTPFVQLDITPAHREFSSNNFQEQALPLLNWYKVRYIVLHTEREWVSAREEASSRAIIAQLLGKDAKPTAKDGQQELYLVPEYAGPTANAWGSVGDDWYALEGSNNADFSRWSAGDSRIFLFNPNSAPQRYQLDMSLYSYPDNRSIEFWFNGQLIAKKEVTPAIQPETFELTLPSGLSTLGLKATGQPVRPIDRNQGTDRRALSFGVKQLKLTLATS